VALLQRHDATVPAVTRQTLIFQTIMNRRQFLQLAAAASTTAALLPAAPAASGICFAAATRL
jgi:hypothetical protein